MIGFFRKLGALIALPMWIGLLVFLPATKSMASHNLAGQITYEKIGPNLFEVTITTYTDPSDQLVDRCTLDLEIYDLDDNLITTITEIPRENGPATDPIYPITSCTTPTSAGIMPRSGEYIIGTIKKNIYRTTVTLNPGNYKVAMTDGNRIDNIANMTMSLNLAFHVNTWIRNNPSIGSNGSPLFLNDPIDFACTGKTWTHNPGGYDPEGDSLVYRLIPNQKDISTPVDGYRFPNEFGGTFTQDPTTGMITWDAPEEVGIYNIAFVVEEWRNGFKIGEAIRDMAVFVTPCNNDPPIIEAITDTCIQAGDTLVLDFKVWDPNLGDSVYFQLNNGGIGLNGPFATDLTPPASISMQVGVLPPYTSVPIGVTDTIFGTITWNTNCSHIRPSFYQIDLYAHDNFSYYNSPPKEMLSTHHVIKVTVVPPKVENLSLTLGPRQVSLDWDRFECENAIGYHVYRSMAGPGSIDTVCCGQNPGNAGYEKIYSTVTLDETSYFDDLSGMDLDFGNDICYLVVAYFGPDELSCPSNIECISLDMSSFVMTNDSVNVTDSVAGSVFVSWSTRDTSVIDPVFFPGPYTYNLYRADGIKGFSFSQINSTPIPFSDTTFMDLGLNTVDQGYKYEVELEDAFGKLVTSNKASSIYLETFAGDKTLLLQWKEYVPWENHSYEIFRADTITGPYVRLDSISPAPGFVHTYLDTGLTNYETYCYFIRSHGEYPNLSNVKRPLINDSQRRCDMPRDTTPPCISEALFDTLSDCIAFNIDFWFSEPDSSCAGDLDFFTLYAASDSAGPFSVRQIIPKDSSHIRITSPGSIAGCYGITATDTVGNESDMILYCFDNCPEFEPSNVFTPNGDGINDFFNPFKDRAVVVKSVKIFDRWGAELFRREGDLEPRRLWDGLTNGGKSATEGVYYYLIEYEEIRLGGNVLKEPLVGWLTIMR